MKQIQNQLKFLANKNDEDLKEHKKRAETLECFEKTEIRDESTRNGVHLLINTFCWLPDNLVIGPEGRYRAADPEKCGVKSTIDVELLFKSDDLDEDKLLEVFELVQQEPYDIQSWNICKDSNVTNSRMLHSITYFVTYLLDNPEQIMGKLKNANKEFKKMDKFSKIMDDEEKTAIEKNMDIRNRIDSDENFAHNEKVIEFIDKTTLIKKSI